MQVVSLWSRDAAPSSSTKLVEIFHVGSKCSVTGYITVHFFPLIFGSVVLSLALLLTLSSLNFSSVITGA